MVPPPSVSLVPTPGDHQLSTSFQKRQWTLVFLRFHRARFQQDHLPGWLCEQPWCQCPQEEKGALGLSPSIRVEPYGDKLSACSRTTNPLSPQVCNTYSSAALSQAGVFNIQLMEAGTLAFPSAPPQTQQGVRLMLLFIHHSCTLNRHRGCAGCQRELSFK